MKTLVLYDSAYGNTAQAAKSIGGAIAGAINGASDSGASYAGFTGGGASIDDDVQVRHIAELDPRSLGRVDLLIVGSPTQNRKPTQAMRDFLDKLPDSALQGTRAAAFDTRLSGGLVALFAAAKKIAGALEAKGAVMASAPEGFVVSHKEGPLKAGELERAAVWAKTTAGVA